jgi:hypothetical protein
MDDGIFGRFPPVNTRVFSTTPRRAARSDNLFMAMCILRLEASLSA